jgi:trans-2,3-dihydro-3-hydroxyanthranilate isomerase
VIWNKQRDSSTREYRFVQVDVFAERAFGGNPLAVFPDAGDLTTEEMQAVALEMNLSETTFVQPAQVPEAEFRVRIFTPRSELPFAGHPVVGTHWVLGELGRVRLDESVVTVRFELGVGVLPADLYVEDGSVVKVVMTQGRPTFQGVLGDVGDLARGLGIDAAAITETGLPAQVVSTGVPQLMVPVRSLREVRAMDAGRLRLSALDRACDPVGTDCVMVFSLETERPDADVHARMFAPRLGILEDPATGSANGALGAYLVKHRAVPTEDGTVYLLSEQGAEMGRPSVLHLEVDHEAGEPSTVRVGGRVVPVAEGTLRF